MYTIKAKGILGQTLGVLTLATKDYSKIREFRDRISRKYGATVAIEIVEGE